MKQRKFSIGDEVFINSIFGFVKSVIIKSRYRKHRFEYLTRNFYVELWLMEEEIWEEIPKELQ